MSENVGHGWTNWRKTTLTDFLYGKAYVSGLLTITNAKLAVEEWLSGKLVAGSEKANSHNDVILKLLAELKDGENKLTDQRTLNYQSTNKGEKQ